MTGEVVAAGFYTDLYAHMQLVPAGVAPTSINVAGAVESANLWHVDTADEKEVVLTRPDGLQCRVTFDGEAPKISKAFSTFATSLRRSLSPLAELASYTLSNGQCHNESEPFQAFEDKSKQRFVVKRGDSLVVYAVFATHIQKLSSTAIADSDLVASSSNYIMVSKHVNGNKIELQAFPDFNLQPGRPFVETYPSDAAALTQLKKTRLITVVNGTQLIVRDTHPHIYRRFEYTFSSPIVSYVVNKVRIACLTEDGKLHTWKLA